MQPHIITMITTELHERLPAYSLAEIRTAVIDLFAGIPASIAGQSLRIVAHAAPNPSISTMLGNNNQFHELNLAFGNHILGDLNQVYINIKLPEPIDPLEAAKALFASIPRGDIPEPDGSGLAASSRMTMFRNEQFVGRADELRTLANYLADSKPTVITTTGIGGVGKTNLVTEFIYRYGQYFAGGVFWLDCADPRFVPTAIAACGGMQHLRLFNDDDQTLATDERVKRVLHEWQKPLPRLLIFDNCETPALLDQYRPRVGGCRIIVTARRPQWLNVLLIALGVLPRRESVALLQTLASHLTADQAAAIAAELGDLPLALHVAGCYLDRYRTDESPQHYLQRLRTINVLEHPALKGKAFLADESLPTKHERDVAKTFAISLERLHPQSPISHLALQFLDYLSQLAPNAVVPKDLLAMLPVTTNDPFDRDDALNRTLQVGLIERQGEHAVRVHQLIHEFLAGSVGSSQGQHSVEATVNSLMDTLGKAGYPQRFTPYEIHARFVTDRALERNDPDAAVLANNLGFLLSSRGNYAAAEACYRQSVAIWHRHGAHDSPQIIFSLNNLANVLDTTGRFAEAEALHRRALELRQRHYGDKHVETAASLNNTAALDRNTGRLVEAESLLRQAVAIYERELGGDHEYTATALGNLAEVLQARGKYAEAEPLYRRALSIRERWLGATHPDTAISLNNLAGLMYMIGRYADAEPFFRRTLAMRKVALGADHTEIAVSLSNLAECLRTMERYAEAEPLYRAALAINEKQFGADHPTTAAMLNNLAALLGSLNQLPESETLHRRALAIREARLGLNHTDTAQSLGHLGNLLRSTGRYTEAEPLFRRALAIRKMQLGDQHPMTGISLDNLANLFRDTERLTDAEPLYRQAFYILRQGVGEDHPHTQKVRQRYWDVLQRMAQSSDRAMSNHARKMLKKEFGVD